MEAFDLSAKFPLPLAPAPRAAELLAGRQAELRRSLRPYLDEMLGRLACALGPLLGDEPPRGAVPTLVRQMNGSSRMPC